MIKDSIWLIFNKKDSSNPNLSWSEAVDEALFCREGDFVSTTGLLYCIKLNHMKLLEIKLENPIGHYEIIRLKSELTSSKRYDFLIIDTGTDDFLSIEVINHLRDQLTDLEPCLSKFKKIAMIHTPSFVQESSSRERYKFFTSKHKAMRWFLK